MNQLAVEKARAALVHQDLEALILHGKQNKRYFGSLVGSGVYLLITQSGVWQILDGRYVSEAHQTTFGIETVVCEKGNYIATILAILAKSGCMKIALDTSDLSIADYRQIHQVFPQLVLWEKELLNIRSVKEAWEIEKIRQACKLSDAIFEKLVERIHVGMTELEVSAEIHSLAFRMGAEKMAFELIVASGVRGAFPHGRPTSKLLARGELVTVDFGVELEGYQSDCTRTFALGQVEERLAHLYRTTLSAQTSAISLVRKGITASSVDKVARDIIDASAFKGHFTHGLGHGMGLGGDLPILSASSLDVLKENMVMTVEPGIYVEGFGGVRIEDVVAIREGVGERLTLFTKEMMTVE